jgi:hypothetical protein
LSTQRYISTSFWDDEWIHSLDPSEKLLYLYFMTNTLTNIAGVYKIGVHRMCFDTGFNENTTKHILDKFKNAGKIHYHEGWIIIPSWPKHQKWDTKDKIRQGIDICLKNTPEDIKSLLPKIGYAYPMDSIGYEPNYSDLNSDSDKDSNPEYDSDLNSDGSKNPWVFQDLWNSFDHLAKFRQIRGTVSPVDLDKIRLHCTPYSKSEIETALRNYATISKNPENFIFVATYQTLISFLSKGVEPCSGELSRFKKKSNGSKVGLGGNDQNKDYSVPEEYQGGTW